MKTNRYFWGTFRSVADSEFVVFRPFTFGDHEYEVGDSFVKEDASRRQMEALFNGKKIKPVDNHSNRPVAPREGTVEREEGVDTNTSNFGDETRADEPSNSAGEKREAVIVEKGAGWLAVETPDGTKIGKSTRDEAEAAEIKARYEAGEDFAD